MRVTFGRTQHCLFAEELVRLVRVTVRVRETLTLTLTLTLPLTLPLTVTVTLPLTRQLIHSPICAVMWPGNSR